MADLGPLNTKYNYQGPHIVSPFYAGLPERFGINVNMDKEIRGLVVEVDDLGTETPIADAVVKLYYRQNDVMVAKRRSESDGSFLFTGLLTGVGLYYAVAFYPGVGGTVPNARIYDRLTAQEP